MYDWDNIDEFFDDEFSEKATYKGSELLVLPYRSTQSYDTSDRGEKGQSSQKLMIRVSDFSTAPRTGDIITFRAKDCRIREVETDSNGKAYILTLGGKYQ